MARNIEDIEKKIEKDASNRKFDSIAEAEIVDHKDGKSTKL